MLAPPYGAMRVDDAIRRPVMAMDVNERGLLHLYLVVGARKSDEETLKNMPAEGGERGRL